MNIYIDESGTFAVPDSPKSRVSAVAAVVIPETQQDRIFRDFVDLRAVWGGGEEVKGSSLNESQISSVIALLAQSDVLVEICTIDTGVLAQAEVMAFKEHQGSRITANLTPGHHPNLIAELEQIQKDWLELPNQLALQLVCMVLVCEQVLRYCPMFYSQRIPSELGRFRWRIDAKDLVPTGYEQVLEQLLGAFLNSTFASRPAIICEGFDYSHYERFVVEVPVAANRHAAEMLTDQADLRGGDLRLILKEDFSFEQSSNNLGLQIADIVAAAVTRAMNGKLQPSGWQDLGRLIVQKPDNAQAVRMIIPATSAPQGETTIVRRNYHGFVMEELTKNVRAMLV